MINTNTENPLDFSVLIPAYNEEKNIINALEETAKVLDQFYQFKRPNSEYEIIVIDDGSTDNTYNKVAGIVNTSPFAVNHRIKIEKYFPNRGKGFALKHGINFAGGRFIFFLDADLDLHPSHLVSMFELMCKNNADVVIGSKMHKDSVLNYPGTRKFLSTSYYKIVKCLFRLPVKDTQTGIKLFKTEALKNSIDKVSTDGYAFDLELLLALHRKKYRILESPIHLTTKREFGRIGIKDAFRVFSDTLRIFWRFYLKKAYD